MKGIVFRTTKKIVDGEVTETITVYLTNDDLDSPKYSPKKSAAKPFPEGIAKAHVRSLTAKHPAAGTYDSINVE